MKHESARTVLFNSIEILKERFTNTMKSHNDLEKGECGYKMPEDTDCRLSTLLSLLNNAETDHINCMSDRKQEKESSKIVLGRLSPPEEQQNMTPELNREVCFPSKAEGSSVDFLEIDTTESSSSVTVLSQSSIQILPAGGHSQSEAQSSSQAITNTNSSSHSNPVSTTSLNTDTGLQMSGHNYNSSTGARPKLIASRTLKKNSRPKNKHKNVTWSEEKKYVTFVDPVTYDHHRNCILNFPLPENSRSSAAVGAVLFMCGKDEKISPSLIDIALKFLWVKLGFCPKAVPLYTTICDFNYDERSFVLAFLELCQTEPSMTVANALFGNIQTLMSAPVNTNPTSQHRSDETDNIPLQAFSSIPEQNNISNSLTDNSNSLTDNINSLTDNKSVINSGLQSTQVVTHEPLKALDFNIPPAISQENLQLSCEANHPVSHIHHATSTKQHQRLPLSEKQMQRLQIEVLKREQEYLKQALTCVLCKNKPAEVTLLPCGHFVLCAACSDECNICPVCNKEALAEVKTFLC